MILRKSLPIISAFVALSFLSDTASFPVNVGCQRPKFQTPSFYVSGKGYELIDCFEKRIRQDYNDIREFIDVRDTTLPEIRYGVLQEAAIGFYNSKDDLIVIDTGRVFYYKGIIGCNFSHELTHAILNRKSQEIGNERWTRYSNFDRSVFTLDDYGMQFVSEGLATYIGNGERNRNGIKWPSNREQLYCSDKYTLGNNLVVDLMEEFGAEAIPSIIKNPPRGNEVFHPWQWQDRTRRRIINQRRNNHH